MDDNEDIHDQVCNTEDVGVVGFSLSSSEELHHASNSQKFVDADFWVAETKVEIEDVGGKHGENIEVKLEAVHVTIP